MKNLYRQTLFGATLLTVLSGLLFDLWGDHDHDFDPLRFVRRPANVQTRDDADLLSGWIDTVDNSWEVGKNHERVRVAFRKIVADARQSTVRIFQGSEQIAMGTILDHRGHIVSKSSEFKGGETLICQTSDGRRRSATIVGRIVDHDVILLRAQNPEGLNPVRWANDSAPLVGSLLATPHLGKVPLAVGVVSLAKRNIPNNGVLGITLADTVDGPFVRDVIVRSAAEEAGIRKGDVVVRVNAEPVADSIELVNLIGKHLPGDRVQVQVRRGNEELTVPIHLGRRADLDQENLNFQNFTGSELSFRRTGFAEVIQHDTFLLPEHCGGPVVDLSGGVIGINIARAERIASFALPAATIRQCVDRLLADQADSSLAKTASASN